MSDLDYNDRAVMAAREASPHYHTSACLNASVLAYCNDKPEPGCICDGAARIAAANAATVERARQRKAP